MWNLEWSPDASPGRAKAVFGYRSIRITGIDVETFARNEVRIIRRQKNRRTDDIFRLPQPAKRDPADSLAHFFGGSGKVIQRSGHQRVHVDSIKAQRLCHRAGHRVDARSSR